MIRLERRAGTRLWTDPGLGSRGVILSRDTDCEAREEGPGRVSSKGPGQRAEEGPGWGSSKVLDEGPGEGPGSLALVACGFCNIRKTMVRYR